MWRNATINSLKEEMAAQRWLNGNAFLTIFHTILGPIPLITSAQNSYKSHMFLLSETCCSRNKILIERCFNGKHKLQINY